MIFAGPTEKSAWLGSLALGQSVALRGEPERTHRSRACASWLPVEPRGYLCEGRDASLDGDDPVIRLLAASAPAVESPWPYHYARSLGAPRYAAVPTVAHQARREGVAFLAKLQHARSRAGAALPDDLRMFTGAEFSLSGLAPPPLLPSGTLPTRGVTHIEHGLAIAWVRRFDAEGRSWLVTVDHALVPADRVELFEERGADDASGFGGVELGGARRLPLAFARAKGAAAYTCASESDASCQPTGQSVAPRAALDLAPPREGSLFVRHRDGRAFRRSDLFVVEPRGVPPEGLTGRRTWVEVSTVGGWLVAYEGDTPVFATLVSAGRGDLLPDGTMVPFSASPTGTFPITSKFVATTMESPERPGRPVPEVMYTQVFHGPYSLHGAYWHHEWGDRKSSGCINLSPRDARWLFHWTEQPVPTGWNGLRLDPARPTTLVVIHF